MNKQILNFFTVLILFFSVLFALNVSKAKAEYLGNDKPLFVIISTDWCYACKMLHPIVQELENQYVGQVTFLHLDASNEAAVNASRLVAAQYGLAAYFDANRNVFPNVGILCPGSTIPEKIIIGANAKETYIDAITSFILDTTKICSINGRPIVSISGPDRPDEPTIPEIIGSRPDTPNFLDRPNEVINSGRPNELSFWTAGQPIPYYAYYQYLLIPKCSAGNNVICVNNVSVSVSDVKSNPGPAFKPYDPNVTRNEKGYHF